MKILMVNNRLKVYGGEGTYMTSVGDELIKQGHDVQYFGLPDKDKLHGNKFDIYAKKSKNPFSIFKSKYNRKQFAKILDAFHPDIVHLNLIYYTLTPYILLEAKKRNIPVVQTIHDSKMVCPSYQLFDFTISKPCSKCVDGRFKRCFKNKCVKNSNILSFLAYKEQKYNNKKNYYNLIDKFIFPSSFMKDLHIQAGLQPKKCFVLPNFSRLQPKTANIKKHNYYIYFGRVNYLKGMTVLAEAAIKLPNIDFFIVGEGDALSLFDDLPNCKTFGFKTGDELNKLISEARASIYPSILMENCPMSVAESILLGTPVICSDIGGIPELVDNNKNAVLFRSGDVQDLVNSINKLEDDNIIKQLHLNCLNNHKVMNISMYIERLVSFYNELINPKDK